MQNRIEQNFYFKIALGSLASGIIPVCEKSRNIIILAWQESKTIFALDVHVLGLENATTGMQQPSDRFIHPQGLANCDICNGSPHYRVGKAADYNALNYSITPPMWLVYVRAQHWSHVGQGKFCLRVCQVVFLWYYIFAPATD